MIIASEFSRPKLPQSANAWNSQLPAHTLPHFRVVRNVLFSTFRPTTSGYSDYAGRRYQPGY